MSFSEMFNRLSPKEQDIEGVEKDIKKDIKHLQKNVEQTMNDNYKAFFDYLKSELISTDPTTEQKINFIEKKRLVIEDYINNKDPKKELDITKDHYTWINDSDITKIKIETKTFIQNLAYKTDLEESYKNLIPKEKAKIIAEIMNKQIEMMGNQIKKEEKTEWTETENKNKEEKEYKKPSKDKPNQSNSAKKNAPKDTPELKNTTKVEWWWIIKIWWMTYCFTTANNNATSIFGVNILNKDEKLRAYAMIDAEPNKNTYNPRLMKPDVSDIEKRKDYLTSDSKKWTYVDLYLESPGRVPPLNTFWHRASVFYDYAKQEFFALDPYFAPNTTEPKSLQQYLATLKTVWLFPYRANFHPTEKIVKDGKIWYPAPTESDIIA